MAPVVGHAAGRALQRLERDNKTSSPVTSPPPSCHDPGEAGPWKGIHSVSRNAPRRGGVRPRVTPLIAIVLAAQSCLTLCDPMNCSLPGSSVHGIPQTRILEWAAIPFSRGSSQPRIEPRSPILQAVSLPSEPPGKPVTPLRPIFNIESSSNAFRALQRHKLSRHWTDWGSWNEKAPNPSLTHTFQSTP